MHWCLSWCWIWSWNSGGCDKLRFLVQLLGKLTPLLALLEKPAKHGQTLDKRSKFSHTSLQLDLFQYIHTICKGFCSAQLFKNNKHFGDLVGHLQNWGFLWGCQNTKQRPWFSVNLLIIESLRKKCCVFSCLVTRFAWYCLLAILPLWLLQATCTICDHIRTQLLRLRKHGLSAMKTTSSKSRLTCSDLWWTTVSKFVFLKLMI